MDGLQKILMKFSNKFQENSRKVLRKSKKNLQAFLPLFAHLSIIDKGKKLWILIDKNYFRRFPSLVALNLSLKNGDTHRNVKREKKRAVCN